MPDSEERCLSIIPSVGRQAYDMIRSFSQETVDKITIRLNRQAVYAVRIPLILYLDPNVPEALMSIWDCTEGNEYSTPVTNGATNFPFGAWILT